MNKKCFFIKFSEALGFCLAILKSFIRNICKIHNEKLIAYVRDSSELSCHGLLSLLR